MKNKDMKLALRVLDAEENHEPASLKSWALVELFGHQRIVGLVTVDPAEFPGMIRVDVPDLLKDSKVIRPGFTRYVGRAALYGVCPIDESTVRQMLPYTDGRPARPMTMHAGDDPFDQ